MNIKEMNEEIIEKTAGKETDNRLKILELFGGIGAPRKALQNIHRTGSVKGMVKLGFWSQDSDKVRHGNYIYEQP